jgi:hypothetical protein
MKTLPVLLLFSLLLGGCEHIAVALAPDKPVSTTRTEAAVKADQLFWNTLHTGDYAGIPPTLDALLAAYLKDPGDATTAAHVGFLHVWALTERSRLGAVPPNITDHAVLARKYFSEAVRLNPADARFLGFLGASTVSEASIHNDEKLKRQGYYTLVRSIHAWPEFNLFTAGYVMSQKPSNSPQFKEALAWQWLNLDECAGEEVSRATGDYSPYMQLEAKEGAKRVCWNSWIAPHNFEGFFLNMGDMLVKSGNWRLAQKIYANARLTPDYKHWKFAPVLEKRIAQAEQNVILFNSDAPQSRSRQIMVKSAFGCTGCHQER